MFVGCCCALAGAIFVCSWCLGRALKPQVDDDTCSDIPLCDAAQNGELERVRELVADGVLDVDWQDRNGRSALMYAASDGHTAVTEALVTAGAEVDLQMKDGSKKRWMDGMTALMVAAMSGHAAVANVLVEAEAEVDLQKNDGSSALMVAAMNGNAAVMEVLVKAGAQVDLRDEDGWTALIFAAKKGHAAVAEALVEAGAQVDLQTWDSGGWTALMVAAREGRAAIVEALVKAGAQVDLRDKEGETAMYWASDDAVRALLRSADAKTAKRTIKSGWPARNPCGAIPLCDAAQNGELERVRELIADGADVDEQDDKGWTALMRAAAKANATFIEALVKAGVEVDLQNDKGWTALMWAAVKGHAVVVEVLAKAGVEVDLQDGKGWTALMWAASNGRAAVVEALVRAGARRDLQNNGGETALVLGRRSRETALVLRWLVATDDAVRAALLPTPTGENWTAKAEGYGRGVATGPPGNTWAGAVAASGEADEEADHEYQDAAADGVTLEYSIQAALLPQSEGSPSTSVETEAGAVVAAAGEADEEAEDQDAAIDGIAPEVKAAPPGKLEEVPLTSVEKELGVVAAAGEADKEAEDQDAAIDGIAPDSVQAAPPGKLKELPPLVAATQGEGSTAGVVKVVAVAEQSTWDILVTSLVGFLLAYLIFLKKWCCPWDVQLGRGSDALNIPTPVRQGTPAGTVSTPPTKLRAARHEAESEVEYTRVVLPLCLALFVLRAADRP
jgi:ankyrin repeat protein